MTHYNSTLPYPRDLVGYGKDVPHAQWPGQARVAVQFVLNYEEGGENSVLHGDAGSEQFLSEMFNPASYPDRHISMEGIYEYGSRAGVWRILREFEQRGLPLTVFGVGMALERWAPGLGTNGPQLLVWGFFVSTVVLFHATVTINSLAHRWGRQRFDTRDDSRNNLWLALITFGEGWHNNHHFFPGSARQGFRWWEIDLTWYGLRQQAEKHTIDGVTRPSRCLADFVAPKESGIADYAGLFAVTAGLGVEKKEKAFIDALDDYSAIMFKSLADRLAEAFAECLHHRVRTDLWGYAAGEQLSNDDMIAEKYRGIRPAPGYPACPDHSAKTDLFRVLNAEEIGMGLTESLAMTPAASVSGFYIGHPDAVYFNVGKIGEDQLHDMAQRRGMDEKVLERLLAPNL